MLDKHRCSSELFRKKLNHSEAINWLNWIINLQDIARNGLTESAPFLGIALLQLADLQLKTNQPDAALKNAKLSLNKLKPFSHEMPKEVIRANLKHATALGDCMKYELAEQEYSKTYMMTMELQDKELQSEILTLWGSLDSKQSKFTEASNKLKEAVEIRRHLIKIKGIEKYGERLVTSLQCYAINESNRRNLQSALAKLYEGMSVIDVFEARNVPFDLGVKTEVLNLIGTTLFEMHEFEESYKTLAMALESSEDLYKIDRASHLSVLIECQINYANSCMRSERHNEAIIKLNEALALCDNDPKFESERNSLLTNLAEAHQLNGNKSEALRIRQQLIDKLENK